MDVVVAEEPGSLPPRPAQVDVAARDGGSADDPQLPSPQLQDEGGGKRARNGKPALTWSEVDHHHAVVLSGPLAAALRGVMGGVLVNLDSHGEPAACT